ncbi:MAG: HEAT repeat domain-containing protein, partial [Treponemataceae bacterium]
LLTERSLSCRAASGLLKWQRPVPAEPSSAAVLDSEGGVVVGFANGTALRSSAFGEISTFSTSSTPAAVADYAAPMGKRLITSLQDGRIVMENPESGTARLLAAMSAPAVGLAVREDKLGVLLKDGTVTLIDIGTTEVLWTGRSFPSRSWSFRFDERGLYALGDGGAAGFAPDGRRLWNLRIDGAAAPPSLSDEGVLYSGGNDWILYAYQVEERIRTKTDSPYAVVVSGDYGLSKDDPTFLEMNPFALEEASINERLAFIALAVEKNEVGEMEREFTLFLRAIAGSERSAVKKKGLPSVLPQHRSRAADLLGRLGSREVLPFLSDLFRRDPEAVVRAAAAEAVGTIGSDPDGVVLAVFAQAVFPPEPVRDERLLLSIASSIGAVCRFSGPPLSDQGIRLLVYLSSADRPAVVRNRARVELESLTER